VSGSSRPAEYDHNSAEWASALNTPGIPDDTCLNNATETQLLLIDYIW